MSTNKLTSAEIYTIDIQSDADSYPLRENFSTIKNKINEVIDEVAASSIGTTNAETTASRPYHDSLKNRLDSDWNGQCNYVKNGGICTFSSSGNVVNVTAGQAKVDGTDVKWDAAASAAVSYTVANTRYDVVVVNSDSTLSIVLGTASANPVYPDIAITQKPLAYLTVTTSSVSITDCRDQGCYFWDEGRWQYKWKIQQAVGEIITGDIYIKKGTYYEEVDLSGKNNVTLRFENGAKLKRISATNYCIKSINASGTETVGVKVYGADLYGNSKAGSCELLRFEYMNQIEIIDCKFDGNASSTSVHKNYLLDYCYDVVLKNNLYDAYHFDISNIKNVRYRDTELELNPINAIALRKPLLKRAKLFSDIAVGTGPLFNAFDGRYMYVSNETSNNVSIIDTLTQTVVKTITTSNSPGMMSFDGRYMYVCANGVDIINTITQTLIGNVTVGNTPTGIAFDGRYMYITNAGDDDVSIIDTTTQLKTASDITVGNQPGAIAFDGKYMYVCNELDDDVSVINTTTQAKEGADIVVADYPRALAFDGRFMHVCNYTDNKITLIDTITQAKVNPEIATGTGCIGIAFDGKRYMYVCNFTDNDVCRIDTINLEKAGNDIPVGAGCVGIAFDGQYMYVCNFTDNDVSIIKL